MHKLTISAFCAVSLLPHTNTYLSPFHYHVSVTPPLSPRLYRDVSIAPSLTSCLFSGVSVAPRHCLPFLVAMPLSPAPVILSLSWGICLSPSTRSEAPLSHHYHPLVLVEGFSVSPSLPQDASVTLSMPPCLCRRHFCNPVNLPVSIADASVTPS